MELIDNISDFINKKTIKALCAWLIIISIFLALNGCSQKQHSYSNNSQDISISSIDSSVSNSELSNAQTDDQNQYYRVYNGEGIEDRGYYYYELFDKSGNTIKRECTHMNEPHVSMISDDVVKVWVQTGTGMATRWAYYYNVKTGAISKSHLYPLTEKSNFIAYFSESKVIVCDMFDDQVYYKEIRLEKELSDSYEPVEAAIFSDDLKQITITYLYGHDFQETSETVNIQ